MSARTCPGCYRSGIRARTRAMLISPTGTRAALVCTQCAARGMLVVRAETPCTCGRELAHTGENCLTAHRINAAQRAKKGT